MHGRDRRQDHQRQSHPVRAEQEERIDLCGRIAERQRALPEIVQHQAGQHEPRPGPPYRLGAKVTHVGVQRFGPGDAQHHRTEDDEGEALVLNAELDREAWRDRQQHIGMEHDLLDAEDANDEEPRRHHRPEDAADAVCAAPLHREQQDDDHHADRQHVLLKFRCGNLQALDSGEHRDRRSDQSVAEEQAGAGYADQCQRLAHAGAHGDTLGQRHERQDAAFATIVGVHDERHVFHGDDEHEGPEDEGENAEDLGRCDGGIGEELEARLEGVERAGTDIAINHAEHGKQRAHRQRGSAQRAGGGGYGHDRRVASGQPELTAIMGCL
jgi:hypothetical protein